MRPPTYVERYFSLHYALGRARLVGARGGADQALTRAIGMDTCVARHHNGLCILCISQEHPAIRAGVASVKYERELKAVSGKRKRGGSFISSESRLCRVVTRDGAEYSVRCSVRGTIVEYNDNLAKAPQLVHEHPLTHGYLAVILPPTSELNTAVDMLLDATAYRNQLTNLASVSNVSAISNEGEAIRVREA